jgi:hypothetical protein
MRVTRRIGASAGVFLLTGLLALPAAAATVTMWLEPNGDFGFDAASTTAALNAGIEQLADSTFFSNSGTTQISITTPSPISGTSVQGATFANPSTGTSSWTVTAVDRAYDDLWIVIQGHEYNNFQGGPTDSYYTQNHLIGLIVDPADPNWALVRPSGFPDVSYLAYYVGDLAQGASFDVPISYAVAQALKVIQSNPQLCEFPQYHVNFLELAVPEPVMTALLAFGGTLLAIRKRRQTR